MRNLRVAAVLLALGSTSAMASIRSYVWSYNVEVPPEGEAGVEQWVGNRIPDIGDATHAGDGWELWLGMTTVAVERLELAFFAVATSPRAGPLGLSSIHNQARLRLTSNFGLVADVAVLPNPGVGGALYATAGKTLGKFALVANLGMTANYTAPWAAVGAEVYVSAGADYELASMLWLNFEAFAHVFPKLGPGVIFYAGPGIRLVKGRFWGTLNYTMGSDFGLPGICTRFIWGVTL